MRPRGEGGPGSSVPAATDSLQTNVLNPPPCYPATPLIFVADYLDTANYRTPSINNPVMFKYDLL
jgi:hypothetical protein